MKTLKTAFLLTALTLLLLFLGLAFGGERGMTMALVFAVLMNGTAYAGCRQGCTRRLLLPGHVGLATRAEAITGA